MPKKSEMKVDTNPLSNWVIFFVADRYKDSKLNEMVYKNAWMLKRELHESINVGFVDTHSPDGELLKHTFDIESYPTAMLVTGAGSYKMPSIDSLGKDWTTSDIALFAEQGYA